MTSVSHLRIPLEIVESIIDEVSLLNDDFTTLRACALSCRDFLKRSRYHLFRAVTFKYQTKDAVARFQRLESALESSPELALRIREFHIEEKEDAHCIINQPTLPNMLDKLRNLATFSLCFTVPNDWEHFSPDLKRAIVAMLSSNHIVDLSLIDIYNLPAKLTTLISNIPVMTLMDVEFGGQEDTPLAVQPILQSAGSSLRDLTIASFPLHASQSLLDELSPPSCELERLQIFICEEEEPGSTLLTGVKVLSQHRTTLTAIDLSLNLISPEVQYDIDSYLDIGILPHLQSVRLSAEVEDNEVDIIECCAQILSKAREDNEILFIVGYFPFHNPNFIETSRSSWKDLDTLLSGSQFPRLGLVLFTFVPGPEEPLEGGTTPKDVQSLAALLASFLPMMSRRGLIRVHQGLT